MNVENTGPQIARSKIVGNTFKEKLRLLHKKKEAEQASRPKPCSPAAADNGDDKYLRSF
jgi:hypothetical protein